MAGLTLVLAGLGVAGPDASAQEAGEVMRRVVEAAAPGADSALHARFVQRASVEILSGVPGGVLIGSRSHREQRAGTVRLTRTGDIVAVEGRRGDVTPAGLTGTLIRNTLKLADVVAIGRAPIRLLNVSFPSPLSPGAAEHYDFELVSAVANHESEVLEIRVHPTSSVRPTLQGTILIDRRSLAPLRAEFRPSSPEDVPFTRNLRIEQIWSVVDGKAQPEALRVQGDGAVTVAAFGLAEATISFTVETRLSDRAVRPLEPGFEPGVLEVAGAAEVGEAFWHERASGLEPLVPQATPESGRFSFSAAPVIDYNRVGAATLGASARIAFEPVALVVAPAYSFGMREPLWDATLEVDVLDGPPSLLARASHFRQLSPTTVADRTYPRIMNSLVSATLHQDYYDFLRKEGWNAGVEARVGSVRASAGIEDARHRSLDTVARWSLLTWTSRPFQDNPLVHDGRFRTVSAELAWDPIDPFLSVRRLDRPDLRIALIGLVGEAVPDGPTFRLAEALASLGIPLIDAGAAPIALTLLGAIGSSSSVGGDVPPQYQFRLRTSAATIGKPGGLVSPEKGRFGGTAYVVAGAELNLTDLPWRALGLPRWRGRGPELILAGAAARYEHDAADSTYEGTGTAWYSEVGLGLSRIPLFVTDLVQGRVDARIGLGPFGRFGINFTLVAPV